VVVALTALVPAIQSHLTTMIEFTAVTEHATFSIILLINQLMEKQLTKITNVSE